MLKPLTGLLVAALSVTAQTIVFQETFPNIPRTTAKGIRETVTVNDLPNTKTALRLVTTEGGNKHTPHWSSPVFSDELRNHGTDLVIVDYDFKPVTLSARYMLFVKDTTGKQMVAMLYADGKIMPNDGGTWKSHSPMKHGEWHHIRYVINNLTRSYDVYIDDMETPRVKNLSFRYEGTTFPASLWIEGSETEPSETLLTNINISVPQAKGFPAPVFANEPFCAVPAMKINAEPTAEDWDNARSVTLAGAAQERTSVRFLWNNHNLFAKFDCVAKDMKLRANGTTENEGKVWMDDCAELFLMPDANGKNYVHHAVNSLGTQYDALCEAGSKVRDKSFNSNWKTTVTTTKDGWSVLMTVPFAKTPAHGTIWKYLCGRENSCATEVSSWPHTTSFHATENFGFLTFLTEQPDDALAATLNNAFIQLRYTPDLKLKQAREHLDSIPACDYAPLSATSRKIQERFKDIATVVEGDATIADKLAMLSKLPQLNVDIQQHIADINRYLAVFAPGKPGAVNGCIFFPESSTVKAMSNGYIGTLSDKHELLLAQGETNSLQAVLITSAGHEATALNLDVVPDNQLAEELTKLKKVQLFLVQDVRSCMDKKPNYAYPDVLRPSNGKETFDVPQAIVRYWIDIAIPRNFKPGNAVFTVKATSASGKSTLEHQFKLNVEILPFELPAEFSLSTAFCFTPAWGNAFYGKPMTPQQRQVILDFILDHHLDPQNLWNGSRGFLSEEEIRHCISRGMKNIYLPIISAAGNKENMERNLECINRNGWRNRVIAFGYDEVLFNIKQLEAMKKAFTHTKQHFPDIKRLNTSKIDERLYGYVDIWCPLFHQFDKDAAAERLKLGEEIWWYPTDYPLAPYANFNLDSPGIDPRIIPWMTRKLNITGILYWGLNREWYTNAVEHERLLDHEKAVRGMEWMTDDVRAKMAEGLRWPDIPWVPFFRSVFSKTSKPCATTGGGNLMYPGPNWTPWPSTRLKNLRDGLQDIEYIHLLKTTLDAYEKRPDKNPGLVKQAQDALVIPDELVANEQSYSKDANILLKHKKRLAELIIKLKK